MGLTELDGVDCLGGDIGGEGLSGEPGGESHMDDQMARILETGMNESR